MKKRIEHNVQSALASSCVVHLEIKMSARRKKAINVDKIETIR